MRWWIFYNPWPLGDYLLSSVRLIRRRPQDRDSFLVIYLVLLEKLVKDGVEANQRCHCRQNLNPRLVLSVWTLNYFSSFALLEAGELGFHAPHQAILGKRVPWGWHNPPNTSISLPKADVLVPGQRELRVLVHTADRGGGAGKGDSRGICGSTDSVHST